MVLERFSSQLGSFENNHTQQLMRRTLPTDHHLEKLLELKITRDRTHRNV